MKKKLSTILLVGVLLVGLGIFLYPAVSDYWNSFHQSRAISSYVETSAGLSQEEYDQYLDQARAYNQMLLSKENPLVPDEEDWEEYEAALNISGNGIMGYIDIPKIKCTLPIYHGVDESVLQIAVGHIQGSSLPVGGDSTHCVLSGHRGLPSAELFSNLDQLAVGDVFMLDVLDETLTYEVDDIHIVLPQEVDRLGIERGKDLCTLVTCTPYGINTHRMLVRGHRVETAKVSNLRITSEAMQIDPIMVAPVAAAPMLLVLLVLLLTGGRRKRRP